MPELPLYEVLPYVLDVLEVYEEGHTAWLKRTLFYISLLSDSIITLEPGLQARVFAGLKPYLL